MKKKKKEEKAIWPISKSVVCTTTFTIGRHIGLVCDRTFIVLVNTLFAEKYCDLPKVVLTLLTE